VADRQPKPVRAFKQGDWGRAPVTDGRPSCHLCGLVLIRCLIRLAMACIGCRAQPTLRSTFVTLMSCTSTSTVTGDGMGLQMMWWMSSHSISSRQLFTQLSITALAVGKSKPQWVFRVRFVDCDPSEDVRLPFAVRGQPTVGYGRASRSSPQPKVGLGLRWRVCGVLGLGQPTGHLE
jgi:hypothetical protein